MFKLIDEKSGRAIDIGEEVTTFRGEKYRLESFTPPRGPSTGRVYIRAEGAEFAAGYYPSVIGARIVEVAHD